MIKRPQWQHVNQISRATNGLRWPNGGVVDKWLQRRIIGIDIGDPAFKVGSLSPKLENDVGNYAPCSCTTFNNAFATSSYSAENSFLPITPPSPLPDMGLIARQCYEYEDQKKRRRAMLCRSLEEILINDCDLGLRQIATPEDYTDLFQVQMVLMFEWAEKLPEFCLLLDPVDKVSPN
ncbi:hypothetical protein TELCIR_06678 [Teladorsagia circumcincta]|uniref:NR LBD domain-containing protein n=1 Tax=Teladorsagia circumcincta TaxID=45464 RepID=A0A2G9UMQ6_TELCI|nr:hypothetical protein TELCIR_06678 [Teladorsagia circumcincta]